MHIRPIQPKNLPAVQDMIAALAVFHGDTPAPLPAHLEHDLFGPHQWFTIFVAEAPAGGLLGYAALLPTGQLQFGVRGMDIHHLFVQSTARGTGAGAALVKTCIEHARSRDCAYITVGTHPDNENAGAFYEAQGFARRTSSGPRFSVRFQPPTYGPLDGR